MPLDETGPCQESSLAETDSVNDTLQEALSHGGEPQSQVATHEVTTMEIMEGEDLPELKKSLLETNNSGRVPQESFQTLAKNSCT